MDGSVQSMRAIEDNCVDNATAMCELLASRDIADTVERTELGKQIDSQGLDSTKSHHTQTSVSTENTEIHDTESSNDPFKKCIANRKCERIENLLPCSSSNRGVAIDVKDGHASSIENECRICQSGGSEDLISPCKCSGSAKWVHESCIVRWFQVSNTSSCELCARHVLIKKTTKPLQQWRLPRGKLGPCSRVDLWYLFVTIFSICTIIGFGIFHLFIKSKDAESTAVFGAIYALCGVMILLRVHYFYVWFTRRSTFWKKWQRLNRVWKVALPGTVLNVSEEVTFV